MSERDVQMAKRPEEATSTVSPGLRVFCNAASQAPWPLEI